MVVCSYWSAHADDHGKNLMVHAFSVAKEINQSYVSYDVRLTPTCQIDTKDPLDLKWVTPLKGGSSRRDGLNFIEKNLYGLDIEKTKPTSIQGQVKAVKRQGVTLVVQIIAKKSSNRCLVETRISGTKLPSDVIVDSLFLQRFSGNTPTQVAVKGRDTDSGNPVKYVLDLA